MGEKLTFEAMKSYMKNLMDLSLWNRIESDRDAIREEVRAEILKDHFRIGESLEAYDGEKWHLIKVRVSLNDDPWITYVGQQFRRPPKMRQMRPNEIQEALGKFIRSCDYETFQRLVKESGISTEVPE